MEDHQKITHHSYCRSCIRTGAQKTTMTWCSRLVLFSMALSLYTTPLSAETLCGGELVDTLQFVCEDRGFYLGRPYRVGRHRPHRGIVEECCFRSCDLHLLEQYCAKPAKSQRDVSGSSLQAIPVIQVLHKDSSRTPLNLRISRHELWLKKAAQRLRRGVPSILLAKKYKRQAEEAQVREQLDFHRPLIALPSRRPPVLRHVHGGASHQ